MIYNAIWRLDRYSKKVHDMQEYFNFVHVIIDAVTFQRWYLNNMGHDTRESATVEFYCFYSNWK